jgi:hypothetical protein
MLYNRAMKSCFEAKEQAKPFKSSENGLKHTIETFHFLCYINIRRTLT